jgi:hypothetical protein
MVAKACEGCGREFAAQRTDWRFHSVACKERYYLNKRTEDRNMGENAQMYGLGNWVVNNNLVGSVGRVVARVSSNGVFDCIDEYATDRRVKNMQGRGPGYCVEWVELQYKDWGSPEMPNPPVVIAYTPRVLRWIRADTMADSRYAQCECPVKTALAPAKLDDEPSQSLLPLDIEAATEATMRAAVALGNQAADWLRAKGLTL